MKFNLEGASHVKDICLKPGQYLWFRTAEDWNLYYKIISINKASISVSAPGNTKPPNHETTTVHRVLSTSNFSSGTPLLTIEGFGKVRVRMRRNVSA